MAKAKLKEAEHLSIGDSLNNFGGKLSGAVTVFAAKVGDAINVLAETVKESFKNLTKAVKWMAIGKAIKSLGVAILAIAASVIAIGYMYRKDPESMDMAIQFIEILGGIIVSLMVLMTILGQFTSKGMSAFSKAGTAILEMSIALLLIVVTLNKLFKMELPEDSEYKFTLLIGLFSLLGLLILTISVAGAISNGTLKIAGTLLAVCVMLGYMVHSLKTLFKIDLPSDWENKAGILVIMFFLISILMFIIGIAGNLSGGTVKMAGTLIASCVLIYTTVSAIQKLFKMQLPSDWEKKLLILVGVFALVTVVITLVAKAGANAIGTLSAAVTILAMCVALAAIVAALMVLQVLDPQRLIISAIGLGICLIALGAGLYGAGKVVSKESWKSVLTMCLAIGSIVAALAVLTLLDSTKMLLGAVALGTVLLTIGKAMQMSGKKTIKAATCVALLEMALIVGEIAAALYILSEQPWQGMLVAAVAMSLVMYEFSKVLQTISGGSGLANKDKLATILASALVIGEIAAALYILSTQPWSGMIASAAAMALVMYTFTHMLDTISGGSGLGSKTADDKIKNVLKASLVLIPIAACLYFLSEKPWSGMLAAAVAMSAVLLALAESFKIISSTKKLDTSVIVGFLLGTVGVLMIGTALAIAATQPWQSLLAAGAAITGTLLAMAVAFDVMGAAGAAINITTIGAFLAGVVGVAIIGGIIGYIASNDWQSLLAAGAAISMALISIAVVMVICALIGPLGAEALIGMGVLDAFIADLVAILAALGALSKIDGFTDLIANGGEVLASLGGALGKFVGSIIGGFGEGLSNSFPTIGQNLSDFAKNASYFINKMKNVDQSVLTGTTTLVDAITKLSGQTLVNKIKSFLGLDLASSTLGDDFKALGKAVGGFSEEVKDINAGKVKAAAYAAESLSALYDGLPKEGGWMSKITGSGESMEDFAEDMKKLGEGIAAYSQSVDGKVSEDAVQASINAAKIISDFQDNLPNIGGFVQKVFGEQTDLATFGTQLKSFGHALVNYSMVVSKEGAINTEAIQTSVDAATILSDLQNSLGAQGGFVTLISDTALDTFGSNLYSFGNYLVAYSTVISEIDMESLESATIQVGKLVRMAQSMEGIDTSAMTGFGAALATMGNNGMQGIIDSFTNGVGEINNQIALLASSAVSSFKENFNSESLAPVGQTIMTGLVNGMQLYRQQTLIPVIKHICASVLASFRLNLSYDSLSKIGANAAIYLSQGLTSELETLDIACMEVTDAIINGLKLGFDPYSDGSYYTTYEIGQYAAQGLAEGITSKINEIAAAATAAAVAAKGIPPDRSVCINRYGIRYRG
jgi:hypothetical protein